MHRTLVILFTLLALTLMACSAKDEPNPRPFRIVSSGYLIGQIDPCKCPGNPAGGLPRRATVLNREVPDREDALLVDAGNFSSMNPNTGYARTEVMLAGLSKLGYDAINVATRDIRLGYDQLKENQEKYDVPLISANLRLKETGELAFDAYKIVRLDGVDGPMEVAVIGLANAAQGRYIPPESGIDPEDPATALERALSEIPQEVECIVLLADADRATTNAWIASAEESVRETRIDLVIAASTRLGQDSIYISSLPFTTTSRQGKYLDIINMAHSEEKGWLMRKMGYPLNEEVPDDPEMAEYVRQVMDDAGLVVEE